MNAETLDMPRLNAFLLVRGLLERGRVAADGTPPGAMSAVVLFACLGWILYGPADVFPPYVLALLAGIVSGAAMLPYTVIKEANPPEASGTATGVVNFLNFTFSALLGPVFGRILVNVSGGAARMNLEPLLYGVALAIVLTLFLKETGPAVRRPAPLAREVT